MAGQLLYVGKDMAKANVVFTKDNEYYTPKYVVEYFGKFDYDPATNIEQAKYLGIENYDTIDTDGLTKDWTIYNRIWINPPFTIKHKFLEKAVETYNKVHNEIYILVPIEFLTTKRFHNLKCKYRIFIPNGRVKFISGLGKNSKSPAFGSVVLKLAEENTIEYIDLKESE